MNWNEIDIAVGQLGNVAPIRTSDQSIHSITKSKLFSRTRLWNSALYFLLIAALLWFFFFCFFKTKWKQKKTPPANVFRKLDTHQIQDGYHSLPRHNNNNNNSSSCSPTMMPNVSASPSSSVAGKRAVVFGKPLHGATPPPPPTPTPPKAPAFGSWSLLRVKNSNRSTSAPNLGDTHTHTRER